MKRNCKKQYMLKNAIFISTLLIVMGVCSACGKADKNDIARDLSENVAYTATESDGVQENIPESLSYTITSGDSGAINVEAEVYSEGYGQNVPTYKLQKRDKDDAWIRSYAEKLFDNGEYVNVKPYDFCSLEELEAEKQFWEERLMELPENSRGYERVESEIAYIEYDMENFSESDYVEYPEEQLIFKSEIYMDEDNFTGYYEDAQLRGEVDGDLWLLNYNYSTSEYDGEKSNSDAPVLYGSCLEKMDYISNSYEIGLREYENKCDRETAESEARRLLERLGFQNMECVKMTELQPSYHDEKADYFDGYCIIYAPSVNGIKMFSAVWCGVDAGGESVAVQPYVYVLVNSEGVYSFCIMEDYVFEGMLSENSQMLNFQQIDDIAHREFEKQLEENPDTYDITKVQFEYVCVTYDEMNYAMIPVWTYYWEWIRYGDVGTTPFLIVNALDGSVISLSAVNCHWKYY